MNRVAPLALILFSVLPTACQSAAPPPPGPGEEENRPRVERVLTGYQFTEGPAWDGRGHLYFTDVRSSEIIRYDVAEDRAGVFREDSNRANGLMFDALGRLVACEGGAGRIVRIDPRADPSDGSTEKSNGHDPVVLADRYESKRFNSPNDLVIDEAGGTYFTDPRYGNRKNMPMDMEGVYYLSPPPGGEAKSGVGRTTRVIDDLERPNGLVLANNGRVLYVADSAKRIIWAYRVEAPGVLTRRRPFAWMDPDIPGGPDGMTVDAGGNVYAAGQGMIWIWAPTGALLAQIHVPEKPSNCTFGGPENRTLYITARTSLYRIELHAPGGRGGRALKLPDR